MKNKRQAAREAYGNEEASKAVHTAASSNRNKGHVSSPEMGHKTVESAEWDQHIHTCGQGVARGVVFSYALAVALAFSRGSLADLLHSAVIVITAFASFTTALAYFYKRATADVEKFERARERWEADNFLEGEKEEMFEFYEQKGYTREQAREIVNILSTNLPAFVDVMMVEELGILPSPSPGAVFRHSVLTFVSFFLGGAIPCASLYLLLPSLGTVLVLKSTAMLGTSVLCASVLFACGLMFASITIYRKWVVGVIMVGFGLLSLAPILVHLEPSSIQPVALSVVVVASLMFLSRALKSR